MAVGNMIEFSEQNDMAYCLVHKVTDPHDTSMTHDKFECHVDKKTTVRQFVHTVAQYFGINVDSFYLIFNSYQKKSPLETTTVEKLKLIEHDDRSLLEIGLAFGENFVNRFLLYDISSLEESNQALCIVRNVQDSKIYTLLASKHLKASQFYKSVLQLCEMDDCNMNHFKLIFNNHNDFSQINIKEDDPRLLCNIGVEYHHGVKNIFEVLPKDEDDKSKSNESNSYKSSLPLPKQKIRVPLSKLNHFRNGSGLSHILRNETPSPVPIVPGESSCIQYSESIGETVFKYRGLANQAMTCYLNSLLQALFMTPEFRNALYYWKFNSKETGKEASKSVVFQLQQLFLKLQTSSRRCVETVSLTHSFGWGSNEIWRQNDLEELFRRLLDLLEKELKDTTHEDLINKLYQGKMLDYVRCLECGFESSKVSTFLDLTLPIRSTDRTENYNFLTDALDGYIQPELLEGNNQYECSKCLKKCDAHKGMKFIQFPYIFTVHLMRFDFDYVSMNRVKLNNRVEFPQIIDLNCFVSDKTFLENAEILSEVFSEEIFGPCNNNDNNSCNETDTSPTTCDNNENKGIYFSQNNNRELGNSKTEPVEPYIYDLYAIMVHKGTAAGGHYIAYIKDFETNEWFSFNDQNVKKISMKEIEESYGVESSPENSESNSNAYMLMYRMIDKKKNRNVLSQEEFPPHLKSLQNVVNMIDHSGDKDEQTIVQQAMFKVPIVLSNSIQTLESRLFECNTTTTLAQLHNMAIEHFKVTKPSKLVIIDTDSKKVDLDMERKNDLICEILEPKPLLSLLLQVTDNESLITPGHILIKLFMINVETDEDIDVNKLVNIEMEENKKISDLSDLLYLKYDIPTETLLHFVVSIKDNSKVVLNDRTMECSSICNNYVFVFIQPNSINQSTLTQKIKNIVTRFNYTIQLHFVLSSNETDLTIYPKDLRIKDLDKEIIDLTSVDYSIDRERSIKEGTEEMESTISECETQEVNDIEMSDDNSLYVTGDIGENNKFTNDQYAFKIIKSTIEKHGKFDAYIDKRMNVQELKTHLASYTNVSMDLVTINIKKSDNAFEFALPGRSLIELKDFDTIQISYDLLDDQRCGSIYYQYPNNPKGVWTKLFNWVITLGTSVIDTKEEIYAKLLDTYNIDIPLERFRLRKKKGNILMKCYLDEDLWVDAIPQAFEMVVIDLIDRSEHKVCDNREFVIVHHVECDSNTKPIVKCEFEFIVDITSTTFISKQLAQMISEKLNIPKEEIEFGITENFDYFLWNVKMSNWSFYVFDETVCIISQRRPKDSLKMDTTYNDGNLKNENNLSKRDMILKRLEDHFDSKRKKTN